jgi:hypothetical protein
LPVIDMEVRLMNTRAVAIGAMMGSALIFVLVRMAIAANRAAHGWDDDHGYADAAM